jgi:hypothetical protein
MIIHTLSLSLSLSLSENSDHRPKKHILKVGENVKKYREYAMV